MKNLLYKELTLSIHSFFIVLPLILALLFFIPNWFFTLVVMYFFWISVPNIFSNYNAQLDYSFINMLPVTKKDVVTSKIVAFITIEMLHVLLAVVFGIIHNLIYGSFNFSMNINPAFFGLVLATFGLFNIIFLPLYFKTAYRFGRPLIYGCLATLVVVGFFEASAMAIPTVNNVMESSNQLLQVGLLMIGVVVFIILSVLSTKKSIENYAMIR